MIEQEKGTPTLSQPTSGTKERLRKLFFCIAKWVGGLATVVGIIGGGIKIFEYYFSEPDITYTFSKYKVAKVFVYSGELINNASTHAQGLTFKGKFSSKLIDLDIITSDSIEKRQLNNPDGSIIFTLNRLSKKSKCSFDIVVNQNSEISEQVQVSWGSRGSVILLPQESDEKIIRGIRLREKVTGLDLSRKARHKWFEDNARNIR